MSYQRTVEIRKVWTDTSKPNQPRFDVIYRQPRTFAQTERATTFSDWIAATCERGREMGRHVTLTVHENQYGQQSITDAKMVEDAT